MEVDSSLVGLPDFKSGVGRKKPSRVGSIPMHFRHIYSFPNYQNGNEITATC